MPPKRSSSSKGGKADAAQQPTAKASKRSVSVNSVGSSSSDSPSVTPARGAAAQKGARAYISRELSYDDNGAAYLESSATPLEDARRYRPNDKKKAATGTRSKKDEGGKSSSASSSSGFRYLIGALVGITAAGCTMAPQQQPFKGVLDTFFGDGSGSGIVSGLATASAFAGTGGNPFRGACGCYAPTANGELLKRMAIGAPGKVVGYIAERFDEGTFKDKMIAAHEASSDCVAFYTMPSDVESPSDLATIMRDTQEGKAPRPAKRGVLASWWRKARKDPSAAKKKDATASDAGAASTTTPRCHVWAVDDVSSWSQDAWNALKELMDQQSIGGERVLVNPTHTGAIVIRSDDVAAALRDKGMPPRVGFVMKTLKAL